MQRWLCNTPASLLWVLGGVQGTLGTEAISSRPGKYSVGEAKRGITAPMCSTKLNNNIYQQQENPQAFLRVRAVGTLWTVWQRLSRQEAKRQLLEDTCVYFKTRKCIFFPEQAVFFLSATGCIQTFSEYNQQRVYKAFAWLSYQFLSRRVVSCFPSRLLEALRPVKAVLALHDSWILHN